MTTLPTPAQLVALGLTEIEAHAVVSALVLVQSVPEAKLSGACVCMDVEASQSPLWNVLDCLRVLRRLLPDHPAVKRGPGEEECDGFEAGKPGPSGDCDGDGHHKCRECSRLLASAVEEVAR